MGFLQPKLDEDGDASPARPADSALAPPPRRSRRMLLVLLLSALACFVVAAAMLRIFATQRLPELTASELEKAEQLWEQAAPAGYEIDVEILRGRPGTVHVEVRNDEVTAMTRDGRSPAQRTWWYWSVPGMFETLERELEMAEDPVHEVGAASGTRWQLRCEFDPAYGYPRRFHRYVSGGGQEVYWRVTSFVPK